MAQIETCFLYFTNYLTPLGFTEELAAIAFIQDYYSAWCPYNDAYIAPIFQRVALENRKKYEKLVAIYSAEYEPLVNYDRHETESSTRTPNLTTSRLGNSQAIDNRTITKNQTETRADIAVAPEGGGEWQEETLSSVTPYDSTAFADTEKTVRKETGHRETQTSYTGTGDTDNVTRSGTDSSTTTETGTDKNVRRLDVSGNIGTVTAQDMAEQELALAEKMNIFRIIEKDIAAKLFLQVW